MKKTSIILVSTGIVVFCGVSTFIFFPKIFIKGQNVSDVRQESFTSISAISDAVIVPGIPDIVCDIRDYGALAQTGSQSTIAINAAIDDCSSKGGGLVFVPAGTWFSGAITLQSNINFFLDDGAEIIFSTDLQDYLPVVFTRFQGIEFYNFSPLIYAKDSQNVAITGNGKLIGNGDARANWTGEGNFEIARQKLYTMSREGTPPEKRIFGDVEPGIRPSFIQFVNCKDITLDGFTVENGPIWTIHPIYSENFTARNLTIDTWSGNTDGIVIDSTKNVVIENSFFSTGDDAISIKSGLDEDGWRVAKPSENIHIRNITVVKGSSGVSIGSEMSGGVRDVDIRDSIFQNTRHGFRIKSTRSRGGFIENIYVENIAMENMTGDAIDINLAYTTELQGVISSKPILKNIYIKDIYGSGSERLVINMDGLKNSVMEDIHIEDISFVSSARAVSIKNARNVFLNNIQIETESSPMYEIENSQNIRIENPTCAEGISPCFLVGGSETKSIWLIGFDPSDLFKTIETVDGAMQKSVIIKKSN